MPTLKMNGIHRKIALWLDKQIKENFRWHQHLTRFQLSGKLMDTFAW